MVINQENSVGIVETKYFSFDGKIMLENGLDFGPFTVAYETYGKLNEDKSNAILVLHALSAMHMQQVIIRKKTESRWWGRHGRP